MAADPEHPFVSRGGLKLAAGLTGFPFDPAGLTCADFGCSTGGFTDCLLRAGAAHVTAVDTGYGVLDYRLRRDDRVTTLERTNALHATPPAGGVDLVVADMSWTPQRHVVPAALAWLRGPGSRVISLIKPHYEVKGTPEEEALEGGVLPEEVARRVARHTAEAMPALGARALGLVVSPIRGSKKKPRGNTEWLVLLEPGPG